MKTVCFIVAWIWIGASLSAQNLLNNPSLESTTGTSNNVTSYNLVEDWQCLRGTCDVMIDPNNLHPWSVQATPGPNTGGNFGGMWGNGFTAPTEFEAIGQNISEPLEAGQEYQFELAVKRSITPLLQTCPGSIALYGFQQAPTLPLNEEYVADDPAAILLWQSASFTNTEWATIGGSFIAPDNLPYVVVTGGRCPVGTGQSYIFYDDLSLSQPSPCDSTAGFNDLSLEVTDIGCAANGYFITLEICNLGTQPIPTNIPIAIYEDDPTRVSTLEIDDTSNFASVSPGSCFTTSTVYNLVDSLFFVINDEGTQATPYDLESTFIPARFSECDYTNNLALATLSTPINQDIILQDVALVCNGSSTLLTADPNYQSYVWSTGSTGNSTTVTNPGIYTVTATDCGISFVDSIEVMSGSVNPVDLGPDTIICAGERVFYNLDGYASYQWSTNPDGACETCPIFTFLLVTSQKVFVTVTDFSGCTSVDSIFITAKGTTLGGETIQLCEGESITIDGVTYTEDASFLQSLETVDGCDSLNVLQLIFQGLQDTTFESVPLCVGDTVVIDGLPYTDDALVLQTLVGANGCDSLVQTTVEVVPQDSVFSNFTPCAGVEISIFGVDVSRDTTFFRPFSGANDCAGVEVIDVQYFEQDSLFSILNPCSEEVLSIFGQTITSDTIVQGTFTDVNGCEGIEIVEVQYFAQDSIFTRLTPCEGETIQVLGVSIDLDTTVFRTFPDGNGCEGIEAIEVSFLETATANDAQTYCEGDTILIDGMEYTTDTSFVLERIAANGCDSLVSIQLEFLPILLTSELIEPCSGDPVAVFGQLFFQDTLVSNTFTGVNGCDSIHQVSIMYLEPQNTSEVRRLCEGDSFLIGGITVSSDTTILQTFSDVNGCDSIHQTQIFFWPLSSSEERIEFCEGEIAIFLSESYTQDTIVANVLTDQNGCDSTHFITIDFLENVIQTTTLTPCEGTFVEVFGDTILTTQIISQTFTGSNGCDSTHLFNIEFQSTFATQEILQACAGEEVTIQGTIVSSDTSFQQILSAENGCDSVHQTFVSFLQPLSTASAIQACDGASIVIGGVEIVSDTVFVQNLISIEGCDSIHQVNIVFTATIFTNEEIQSCTGESVLIFNQSFTQDTVVSQTFTAQSGCDSIHTVRITFLENQFNSNSVSICEGGSILVFGTEISTPQVISQTFIGANGCDSTQTIIVEVLPVFMTEEILEGCEGESVLYQGITYLQDTSFQQNFTASNGCDSLVEISILFNEIPEVERQEVLCVGAFILFGGDTIRVPGIYQSTVASGINDCGQIETLVVSLADPIGINLPADTVIQRGDQIQIPLEVIGSRPQITWFGEGLSCTDCTQPLARPLETQNYQVLVEDENGCTVQGEIEVLVLDRPRIYFPSAFSPNNDGFNDRFNGFSNREGTLIVQLQIFDRWGSVLYSIDNLSPQDQASGWDGTFNGQPLGIGVYVFQANVRFPDGREQVFAGDLTLLR